MNAQEKKIEVIFCSMDSNLKDYNQYLKEVPWKALEYEDGDVEEILQLYKVRGRTPTLVVLKNGKQVTDCGVREVDSCSDASDYLKLLEKWSSS